MQTISLIREAWYKDQPYNIQFPASWDVSVFGDQRIPEISTEEIKARIQTPIGSRPLSEFNRPDARVTIIIDDLTRPTPVRLPLQMVIAELEKSGVSRDSITVVVGGGSHLPMTADDLQIKLGSPTYQAILDSGVSRLRPVAMAAATTILGMIPLFTDAFFIAMAVTIVFGLLVATVLTMIVVPTFYALFFRAKKDDGGPAPAAPLPDEQATAAPPAVT